MNESPMKAQPIVRRYQGMAAQDIGFTIGKNINFVVDNSLCHGCGACVAACPENAIRMNFIKGEGIYLPSIDPNKCRDSGQCVQSCPGFELDLNWYKRDSDPIVDHDLIGPHIKIYRSFTNNIQRRERASSGGMITEILDYLLTTGKVNGAIVVRMSTNDPLKAEAYIARSSAELLASQKSKYCPVPLNEILRDYIHLKRSDVLAYVGLPGHVHGLRFLQGMHPHLKDQIPYVLSSFTSHIPSQKATEFILYKNGIKPEDIKSIEYRGGGNPGRMRIVLNNGKEIFVPHLHWTYSGHTFPLFFYPVREWLYFDKLSEWADFSCGDNWMDGLKEQKGASTVVTRSQRAEDVMRELISLKKISATFMSPDDLVRDQDLHKKLNIGIRLKIWTRFGRKIPLYTRKFPFISGQFLRTIRFAFYVALFERNISMQISDVIIRFDYYFRSKPVKFLKKLGLRSRQILEIFLIEKRVLHKTKKYKIVLIGGYGCKDIGDESMPHAVRKNLRRHFGDDLDIVMLSHDPMETRKTHGERSARDINRIGHAITASIWRKLFTFCCMIFLVASAWVQKYGIRFRLWTGVREALDEISTCDVILNVGGGNINSIIPVELYKKCTTYLVAKLWGKPVYLSGQTMGPFLGKFDRWLARLSLNTTKMISFRDKTTSHNRLLEIGVHKPVMFDAADDAITLHGVDEATSRMMIEKDCGVNLAVLKSKLVVYLNLKASLNVFRDKHGSGDLENEVSLLADIANTLIDNFECHVVLFPTDFSDTVDDRVYHDRVFNQIRNKKNAFRICGEYRDVELIGMMQFADVAIGSRYHYCVFAAINYVPFIGIASGIYQRTKLQGLADLCGLVSGYIDIDMQTAKLSTILPTIEYVIDNRVEIKKLLQDRLPGLRKASEKITTEVARFMKIDNLVVE
jgi:coenzyme F420 hydrogenase subunit beta